MGQTREVFEPAGTETGDDGTDLKSITGDRLLGQRILRLAFLSPGDLVHRPELGAGLQDFRGKPPTDELLRRLRFRFDVLLDSLDEVESYSFRVAADPATNAARIIDVRVRTDNTSLAIEEISLGDS